MLERALRAAAGLGPSPSSGRCRPTTAAVFEADHDRLLDVAQLDYYVPRGGRPLRAAGSPHGRRVGRGPRPGRPVGRPPGPAPGSPGTCGSAAEPGLDVWVVENGMCNRVRRGRSYPRLDRWTRDRYLRENLAAVVDAVDRGVPVTGYWHWTLADNYEWGSYEPRFGLFGVDRERGLTLRPTDAMGVDAAGAYRTVIAGLRAGDRSVLA